MSKFKVGDAVRVKAGSPKKLWRHGFTWDASHSFGEKLIVEECCSNDKFENRVHLADGHGVIENCYLEPWNDAEEWDGEKWVPKKTADRWFRVKDSGKVYKATAVSPNGSCILQNELSTYYYPKDHVEEVFFYNPDNDKPKPAIVILREDGILKPNSNPTVHESTSKAKAEAKRLAEKHKGKEFVVFQEVDSKRVEKPVYPEFQHGDVVKAVRKAECDVFPGNNPVTLKDACVVVNGNSASDDEYFNAWIGDDLPCYRKSDFIKIGHVDL